MRFAASVGGMAVFAWAAVSAAAPAGLDAGREAYLGARFSAAERAFESVLRDATATRADLVEAYRHLAVLSLVRADPAAADAAALRAVSLDPAVQPPEGAPPEAPALFERARSGAPSAGLQSRLELPEAPAAGAPVGAQVAISGDFGGLAASVSVVCGARAVRAEVVRGQDGAGRASLAIESGRAGARTTCVSSVLTAEGATIAEASGSFVARDPAVVAGGAGGPAPSPAASSQDDGGGFPWLWVGLGTGVVAAGVVAALLFASSGSDGAMLGSPEVVR